MTVIPSVREGSRGSEKPEGCTHGWTRWGRVFQQRLLRRDSLPKKRLLGICGVGCGKVGHELKEWIRNLTVRGWTWTGLA